MILHAHAQPLAIGRLIPLFRPVFSSPGDGAE